MTLFWPRLLLILAVLCSAACSQKIGDSCKTTADCTSGSDRLCDRTLPGGYCTIFNCEPGGCPDEAICIGYRSSLGSTPECENHQQATRLERTFCMRKCSKDSDCREGYACMDFSSNDPLANPWSAEIVDDQSSGVCSIPYDGPAPVPHQSAVCQDDLTPGLPTSLDASSPSTPDASDVDAAGTRDAASTGDAAPDSSADGG
jgi:hypothetical protein